MKHLLPSLLLLTLSIHLSFAGGAATSSQDALLFIIPVVILVLIWGIPKIYNAYKTKGDTNSENSEPKP